MAIIPRLSTPQTSPDTGPARNNRRGMMWLAADLCFNIWALSIAKSLGVDLPPIQIVLVRALVGLAVLIPFVVWRGGMVRLANPKLQILRTMLSTIAMTGNFFAVAKLPFALFTTVNFTRPLLMMALAALILGERIRAKQWIAGGIGLIGVVIAVDPGSLGATSASGIGALFASVIAGTSAVIILRRMRNEDALTQMIWQTAGLSLTSVLPAIYFWQAPGDHWPILLSIGVLSQTAQFCFMRAHYWAEAGVIAPLGYFSLILSVTVGYFVFDEVPSIGLYLGAVLIIGAALMASHKGKRG
ncbi:DMT family transporter (plasmid) [Pseudorhodobacter turbinis]|uniref:DMT family transporter n=1 Tax=Pseudorhodobacter turbinis TaxID=2500533 RepID=A0A4P8EIP6_9RHOB|nr:DMT family transporter [Pseudorhodobacter turbinis]QCO57030.1 DMT family transporter [Pseudorhodobacter turbinis]